VLAKSERPLKFAEVYGAEIPKRVLSAVVRNPEKAPQSYVLCGAYGSGKTSCARIFGRAINCESGRTLGDACNQCLSCKELISTGGGNYLEFDAAIVGNVNTMRELRDRLGYLYSSGFRVVVFDECHMASGEAQSSLLKTLEDSPRGVFYIFSTTEADKLLDTILSRSLVLTFDGLSRSEMTDLVTKVAAKEQIEVDDFIKHYIVRRVSGHARDGMQQLELLRLMGTSEYKRQAILLDESILLFFKRMAANDRVDAERIATELCSFPIAYLAQDFEFFTRRLVEKVFIVKDPTYLPFSKLVFYFLENHKHLGSSNDWYLFLMSTASFFEKKEQGSSERWVKEKDGTKPKV